MCLNAGPFTMAAGDTQEVVVAAIAAQGSSNLSSVSLLKYYDDLAQTAYNFFFNLPSAPPPPKVTVAALNDSIVLDWGSPASIAADENFSSSGYGFQGYNVWQLPSNSTTGAKRLATYDLTTSHGIIEDMAFDPTTGFVLTEPVQFGTKQGLKRSITITQDAFTSSSIVNNRDYYFAVTAYSYNGTGVEPNNLESPIAGNIIDVRPQTLAPGTTSPSAGTFSNVTHAGTADASVNLTVVDPPLVTGDKYQVSFHNEIYSVGSDGIWNDVTPPGSKSKRLGRLADLTGSSLANTGSWTETKGQFVIHYTVNVVSADFDFCDGIKMQFPTSLVIDTIYEPTSNNNGSPITYTLDRSTNTVMFGNIARDSNGVFAGGEDIELVSHATPVLPIIATYTMYDDGYGGNIVDVTGADTLTAIANQMVVQHQWNVTDVTKGKVVLANQTVYGGVDIYDQTTYFKANGFYGPGGSSGTIAHNVGTNPIPFDGLQAAVSGSFVAPTTMGKVFVNGTELTFGTSTGGPAWTDANGNWDFTDFIFFGYADGLAATSLPVYAAGGGSHDVNLLQQDYELRWTGVLGDTIINGDTVIITKSGGSLATLIGVHSPASMATYPLNPNPGSSASFVVRIPFEVWCTDKNEQVNLLFYDRSGNPASPGFQVWNTLSREYVWVVSTKYTGSTTPIDPAAVIDSTTWNWVIYASKFKTGDDVKIIYNNPLQLGLDSFTFTVPNVQYSTSLAKQDVSQINVFPNPYFGFNPLEADKYTRWVRFTHLPQQATIRIFNLAGILVRTLVKNDNTQFADWDLLNENQLPVAAGMYIAYIDCHALGTKTLKLAIIPEQQFLDHY